MNEENQTQEIFRKTRELCILRNRILRYWKRLTAISFKVAKEKGIEFIVTKNYEDQINNLLENPNTIQIYEQGELCNADELIELSRNIAPSLYGKYKRESRKYYSGISELKDMIN